MSTFSANGSPTCTPGAWSGRRRRRCRRRGWMPRRSRRRRCAPRTARPCCPTPARVGQVQILVPQHADRERVDQRVRLVDRVEPGLAADVRQSEAVGVEADAADDAGHDARGVGVVDRAEAQRIHDGDRARAHRDDVAHDAADAGRGALERLDVARVVVALDLEGDRPALADVDDAGVLAHADHEVLGHLGADLLAELPQPDLARLVRAVLAPHHRVHGELTAGGTPAEDVAGCAGTRRSSGRAPRTAAPSPGWRWRSRRSRRSGRAWGREWMRTRGRDLSLGGLLHSIRGHSTGRRIRCCMVAR